jgi:hypothetical protein
MDFDPKTRASDARARVHFVEVMIYMFMMMIITSLHVVQGMFGRYVKVDSIN